MRENIVRKKQLSDDMRRNIIQKYECGKTPKEISKQTGIKPLLLPYKR